MDSDLSSVTFQPKTDAEHQIMALEREFRRRCSEHGLTDFTAQTAAWLACGDLFGLRPISEDGSSDDV